jgi:hypothetical protein
MSGDGKVTKKDILIARGVIKKTKKKGKKKIMTSKYHKTKSGKMARKAFGTIFNKRKKELQWALVKNEKTWKQRCTNS